MARRTHINGIRLRQPDGRAVIKCRDGSETYFYRALMEAQVGRELRRGEVVHHLNGDCTDDRPENLRLTTQTEHARGHGHSWRSSRWPSRRCAGCGCDHDELRPGCRHCVDRHKKRAA